jgi:phospholipid/cholesterol/gamma-HCH transport system permease protein
VRFRFPSIIRHMHETGVQALPIICLLALGISMVISYQGAVQLQKFGADIYTIDLTVISLLREMAVLTTAIMVAGRSGSAFAAEIGVMKMRGEVDALQTMGLNPIETLVVPRLLALLLTLPMLCFIADIVGLAGGGLISLIKLDISLPQYINRLQAIVTPTMFFIGMVKAPVFALLITAVCTYQGMNASGSAENVGKLTTLAVVQSIFLVIMADAVFSVIFSGVGI